MSDTKTEPQIHPAANIYDMMKPSELHQLAESIKEIGLRRPIELHPDGRILDGRNRFKACAMAGVEPVFTRWIPLHAEDSPVTYVAHVHSKLRNNLTPDRKALAASRMIDELGREAAARAQEGRIEGGKKAGRGRPLDSSCDGALQKLSKKYDDGNRTIWRAARAVGAGIHLTEVVAWAQKHEPRLYQMVVDDKIKLTLVLKLKNLKAGDRRRIIDKIEAGENVDMVLTPPSEISRESAYGSNEDLLILSKAFDKFAKTASKLVRDAKTIKRLCKTKSLIVSEVEGELLKLDIIEGMRAIAEVVQLLNMKPEDFYGQGSDCARGGTDDEGPSNLVLHE